MRTGMDELDFIVPKSRRRKSADTQTRSLFEEQSPPKLLPKKRPPFRHESDTSEAASDRIAPSFRGNMATCYQSIVSSAPQGCTRKQIADWHFEGKQNYVTGPVDRLLKEHRVYEIPEKNPDGTIARRDDGSIIPQRLDGSALLLPVRAS